MKTHTLASIYLFILVLTLGAILAAQLNVATVTANVEINPARVDLGAESPKRFKFKLWFSGKYKNFNVSNIDPQTIKIENIPFPIGKGKGVWKVIDNTVTFKVNGHQLIDFVIWPKIYHMGRVDPNPDKGTWFPYQIDITVTGQFYNGPSFSGTDTIKVYVSVTNPTTLPPPP